MADGRQHVAANSHPTLKSSSVVANINQSPSTIRDTQIAVLRRVEIIPIYYGDISRGKGKPNCLSQANAKAFNRVL